MKQRIQQPREIPHIGIVGAGVSGLRCADILIQHGFKVTILEGRDRIGGRMCQHKLPSGHLVDLGPNWIHGSEDNPILDMAKQTGSITHVWEEPPILYDESGTPLPTAEANELSELMWGIVLEAFEYSNKNTSTIDPQESLYDFFLLKVLEKFPSPRDKSDSEAFAAAEAEQARKRKIVLQIANLWGAFVGSPVYRQTLKYFWLEECIDGENLFCADTYKKMLTQIAKTAVARAEIRYLTEVKKIVSEPQEGQLEKVTVETVKGDQIKFDEVVMTAPLGWLQQHPDAFVPALPDRLSKGINSIGYGCLEKVYITFPAAFWQEVSRSNIQASEGTVILNGTKKVDNSKGKTFGFAQFLSPKAYASNNPECWSQEIVNLASLPGSCAQSTLLFYIFGEQSKAQSAELAKMKSDTEREHYLNDFYKQYYSLLPNYAETDSNCQPSNIYATDWLKDDLAGNGSYSNFQVGLEEGDEDIIAMRQGVPERGLWLAGEHTAPFVALGTVTGAYWSGEFVGKKIAAAYGLGEEDPSIAAGTGLEASDKRKKETDVRGFADKGLEA